uniref:Uncharacterized protein n=1 Tax=Arundo donax TaxID=35708 RepID=A0A0A8YSW9_ARUDO
MTAMVKRKLPVVYFFQPTTGQQYC